MSQQTDEKAGNLPDPAEMAKTYAEVAQRASRLISQFVEKKAKNGVNEEGGQPLQGRGMGTAFPV